MQCLYRRHWASVRKEIEASKALEEATQGAVDFTSQAAIYGRVRTYLKRKYDYVDLAYSRTYPARVAKQYVQREVKKLIKRDPAKLSATLSDMKCSENNA